ncbi:hypothetical protein [Mesorhizobium sp. M0898]|uniref:hypothetical protein n=1 Tax=Mesorhizobium sp. M0898 TaxID=2957020 RepID=UPI00333CEAE9
MHLKRSKANRQLHMAIGYAGKNSYLASFTNGCLIRSSASCICTSNIKRSGDGYLLSDEHNLTLEGIRVKDV